MRSGKKIRRRILLTILSLSLATLGTLALKNWLLEKAKWYLQTRLAAKVQGSIAIDELHLSMFSPTMELRGIRIKSAFLGIDSLHLQEATVTLRPLPIFLGKISFANVGARHGQLRLRLPIAAINQAKAKPEKPGSLPQFELLKLELLKGSIKDFSAEIIGPDDSWRASLTLESFSSRAARRGRQELKYEAHGKIRVRDKAGQTQEHPIEKFMGGAVVGKDYLVADQAKLSSPILNASLDGSILPELNAKLTLGSLFETLLPSIPMRGELTLSGKLQGELKEPRFVGKFKGRRIYFEPSKNLSVQLGEVDSSIDLNRRRLLLNEIAWQKDNSKIAGDGSWQFNTGDFSGALNVEKILLREISGSLKRLQPSLPLIEGTATGKVGFRGNKPLSGGAAYIEITPDVAVDQFNFSDKSHALDINNIRVVAAIVGNQGLKEWQLPNFSLSSDKVNLTGSARITPALVQANARGNLTTFWQQLHPALAQIDGALDFDGSFHIEGEHREGRFNIQSSDLKVGGVNAWQLKSQLLLTNQSLQIAPFSLSHGAQRLSAVGDFNVSDQNFGLFRMQLVDIPSSFVLALLPMEQQNRQAILEKVQGDIAGNIEFRGPLQTPDGSVELAVNHATVLGEAIDRMEFASRFREGNYDLQRLWIQKGEAAIKVHGNINTQRGDLGIEFASSQLRTDLFRKWRKVFPKSLPLKASGRLFGTLKEPQVDLQAALYRESDKELLRATLGGPTASPTLITRINGNPSEIKLVLGKHGRYTGSLVNLEPLAIFRELGMDVPKNLLARLSGEFDLSTEGPGTLQGSVDIQSFTLQRKQLTIFDQSQIALKMRHGKTYIDGCRLVGPGTDLKCHDDQRLTGDLSIGFLTTLVEPITRSEGSVKMNLHLASAVEDMDIRGKMKLRDALLVIREFPVVFENLSFDIEADRNVFDVKQVSATVGDGSMRGAGEVSMPKLGEILFNLQADVQNFPSRFPEDFPGAATGNVRFTGPWNNATLEGSFNVDKLLYTKRYDWRSRMISMNNRDRTSKTSFDQKPKGKGVNFLLRFAAPSPVIVVKNNLGNILVRGEFTVMGKFPEVGIVGTFNADSGKIVFRDHIFDIDSGTLAFQDPRTLDYFVDVYARSKIREYLVTINMHTVQGQIRVDMQSSPPLSETDLLALITVGSLTDPYTTSLTEQGRIRESIALGIVSGNLQEKVEKIGIIDSFQVIPAYSQTTKNTELRLMVGKKIMDDLQAIYSTDLYNIGLNQEVRLRQNLQNNFAVQGLMKNTQPRNRGIDLGVDFEFSFDF